MRNPKRISQVLYYINCIWQKQPDTRFNQLIHNLQWEYAHVNDAYKTELWEREDYKGIMSFRQHLTVDLFNLEDDKFMEFLKEKVDKSNE